MYETVKPLLQSVDFELEAVIKRLNNDNNEVQVLKDKLSTVFAEALLTAKADVFRTQSVPDSAEARVADEEQALEDYDRELTYVMFKREGYPKKIQNKTKRKLLLQYKSLVLLSVDKEDTESLLMPDYQHRSCPREIASLANTASQIRAKAKELECLPTKVEEINVCLDIDERYEKQDWKSLLRKRQG